MAAAPRSRSLPSVARRPAPIPSAVGRRREPAGARARTKLREMADLLREMEVEQFLDEVRVLRVETMDTLSAIADTGNVLINTWLATSMTGGIDFDVIMDAFEATAAELRTQSAAATRRAEEDPGVSKLA